MLRSQQLEPTSLVASDTRTWSRTEARLTLTLKSVRSNTSECNLLTSILITMPVLEIRWSAMSKVSNQGKTFLRTLLTVLSSWETTPQTISMCNRDKISPSLSQLSVRRRTQTVLQRIIRRISSAISLTRARSQGIPLNSVLIELVLKTTFLKPPHKRIEMLISLMRRCRTICFSERASLVTS